MRGETFLYAGAVTALVRDYLERGRGSETGRVRSRRASSRCSSSSPRATPATRSPSCWSSAQDGRPPSREHPREARDARPRRAHALRHPPRPDRALNRRKRASGRHITSPRCESVPMVSDPTQEHDGTHDRHETSRAAEERSRGSASRQRRAYGERARRGPCRRARHPREARGDMASQADEWPSPTGADPRMLCDPSPGYCSWLGPQLDRPALTLRARVFASRRSLDEALADGASPLWTPELALRARQLVSRSSRQQLATRLERLVKEATRSVSPRAVAVPLPRREILEAQTSLFSIASCLRDERFRCTREGWRCCRAAQRRRAVPRTTRTPARCAMRSERSRRRLTVNGVTTAAMPWLPTVMPTCRAGGAGGLR